MLLTNVKAPGPLVFTIKGDLGVKTKMAVDENQDGWRWP